MNITVTVPPPFEPVTLAQVYKQLRLTPDHSGSPGEETHPDDVQLLGMIKTAREQVEAMARRSLVQQQLRLSMPSVCNILLHRPPLIRVDSVRYYDADNSLQTVDPITYYTTDEQVPQLRFITSASPTSLYCRPDAIRVDYTTGYAPSGSPSMTQEDYIGNVPSAFRDAILIGVQLLYDDIAPADREQMERMIEALVQPRRVQLAV